MQIILKRVQIYLNKHIHHSIVFITKDWKQLIGPLIGVVQFILVHLYSV